MAISVDIAAIATTPKNSYRLATTSASHAFISSGTFFQTMRKFSAAAEKARDRSLPFGASDPQRSIRLAGMTHVGTSPFCPQSNGKLERYHKTIKVECIHLKVALSLEERRAQIADYVCYYNDVRLHSSIGYVAPKSKLDGREKQIFRERDQKLEAARAARMEKRQEEKHRTAHHQIPATGEVFNPLTKQGQFSISS
ncbi:MAG: transposase [Spirochaetales bacterium]|nr:transposase [Spirochaetales bacterium]